MGRADGGAPPPSPPDGAVLLHALRAPLPRYRPGHAGGCLPCGWVAGELLSRSRQSEGHRSRRRTDPSALNRGIGPGCRLRVAHALALWYGLGRGRGIGLGLGMGHFLGGLRGGLGRGDEARGVAHDIPHDLHLTPLAKARCTDASCDRLCTCNAELPPFF